MSPAGWKQHVSAAAVREVGPGLSVGWPRPAAEKMSGVSGLWSGEIASIPVSFRQKVVVFRLNVQNSLLFLLHSRLPQEKMTDLSQITVLLPPLRLIFAMAN